jgi:acyl-CoA dehydrogenase
LIQFRLTRQQQILKDKATKFAQQEIIPVATKYDKEAKLPLDVLQKALDQGLMNLTIPKQYGGGGLGLVDHCIISEELCFGCSAIAASITVNSLAAIPILIAGSSEQKKTFLTPLCTAQEPKVISFAVTEEAGGSDISMMNSSAKKVGKEYILNGTKKFIGNGAYADFYVVLAYTDRSFKHKGLSAFIVPKGKGVSITKVWEKMGHRSIPTADVSFNEVHVPISNRLGNEGDGFKIAMQNFNATRPIVAASAVGIGRRAMEESIRYAKERNAFGTAIANYQSVSFTIADMGKDIEAARLLSWQAAWMGDRHKIITRLAKKRVPDLAKLASYAKIFATDVAMRVTGEAIDIFGGNGYMAEFPIEKLMRDAKLLQIVEGTNRIQRLVASREILVGKS